MVATFLSNFARAQRQPVDRWSVGVILLCGLILGPVLAVLVAAFGDKADQKEWAQAIRLVFTNQSNRGNHMNISGGGVAKHTKNKAAAIAFLEFLTEEKAQHLYGEINFEYPINPAVSVDGELASWGRFKPDNLPVERLAALAPKAQMIIDRVGW